MPSLKKRHHYVPQFWIRGFADGENQLHAWNGKRIRVVRASDIMQEPWLYTLFDQRWTPADTLEDALGQIESMIAPIFDRLNDQQHVVSSEDHENFCRFLGLQACRHPDVMARGNRRARELSAFFTRVHEFPPADFILRLAEFGIDPTEACLIRQCLATKTTKS